MPPPYDYFSQSSGYSSFFKSASYTEKFQNIFEKQKSSLSHVDPDISDEEELNEENQNIVKHLENEFTTMEYNTQNFVSAYTTPEPSVTKKKSIDEEETKLPDNFFSSSIVIPSYVPKKKQLPKLYL